MADGKGCTCGSGGHPRRCVKHPLAFDAHVAEINLWGLFESDVDTTEAKEAIDVVVRAAYERGRADERADVAAWIDDAMKRRIFGTQDAKRRILAGEHDMRRKRPPKNPPPLGITGPCCTHKDEEIARLREAISAAYVQVEFHSHGEGATRAAMILRAALKTGGTP